jgi:Fe2+ or Zn2+ uptake regulation protein
MNDTTSILEGIITACRAAGLRKTRALSDVLAVLLDANRPMTLPELAGNDSLRAHYDQATLYRLLTRLEENNIVQRLGLHERAAHYILKLAGKHDDYLICTECGSIESLDAACPVHALEKEIARTSGYTNLHHELEFFGICPGCSA